MERSCRRVVTGHNSVGKAVVLSDDIRQTEPIPTGEAWFSKLWVTDRTPADNNGTADGALIPTGLTSPTGSVLRVVDMPPGMRSPMHRTLSVDYGIVLDGQVDMELDGGERVQLQRGDVVVQRGTIHAWVNRGDRMARMAFVLIAANPVDVGDRSLPEESH